MHNSALQSCLKEDWKAASDSKFEVLEQAVRANCSKRAYAAIRNITPRVNTGAKILRVTDSNGIPCHNRPAEKLAFRQCFSGQMNGTFSSFEDLICKEHNNNSSQVIPDDLLVINRYDITNAVPSTSELQRSFRVTNASKAWGESNISGHIPAVHHKHLISLYYALVLKSFSIEDVFPFLASFVAILNPDQVPSSQSALFGL